MLPKGKRLSRASFSSVVKGKTANSRHFSVRWTMGGEGRASAVVSKKVAKKAVDRAFLKRRIREVISPAVMSGRSFIVYARAGSTTLPYKSLHTELTELLAQLPRERSAV